MISRRGTIIVCCLFVALNRGQLINGLPLSEDEDASDDVTQYTAKGVDQGETAAAFDESVKMWSEWIRKKVVEFAEMEAKRRATITPARNASSNYGSNKQPQTAPGAKPSLDARNYPCGMNKVDELVREAKAAGRVVGGTPTDFGRYPWIISVREFDDDGQPGYHFCGASLINSNWAVTAAHCLVGNGTRTTAPQLVLRLGEYDFSTTNESYPHLDMKVAKVRVHPEFNSTTITNDIALMKFAQPVEFTKNILPVCLPSPQENRTFVKHVAQLAGWGNLWHKGPSPEVLQHVQVPIITNKKCSLLTNGRKFPTTQFCAGSVLEMKDSCQGDSGGPLVVGVDGHSMLVGITSYGFKCGSNGPKPGVYTRVTEFLPWIERVMAKN